MNEELETTINDLPSHQDEKVESSSAANEPKCVCRTVRYSYANLEGLRIAGNSLRVEIADFSEVRIIGSCGAVFVLSIDDYFILHRKIKEKWEISATERRIKETREELIKQEETLQKLKQFDGVSAFHPSRFPVEK